MAENYVTLVELKQMRDIKDTADDALLSRALSVASRRIDGKTRRRFWLDAEATPRLVNAVGRVTPDGRLLVDDIGSLDDLAVDGGSVGAWSPISGWETGPDNALDQGWSVTELVGSWPARVRITARWGWPAVPEDITMACLLLASRLFSRKESPEGVLGSVEWGSVRVSRWDPDVEALVAPYVQPKMP